MRRRLGVLQAATLRRTPGAIYSSDFSGGVDGWVPSSRSSAVVQASASDGSTTYQNVLRFTRNSAGGGYNIVRSATTLTAGTSYRIQFNYKYSSTSSWNRAHITSNGTEIIPQTTTWNTFNQVIVPAATNALIVAFLVNPDPGAYLDLVNMVITLA